MKRLIKVHLHLVYRLLPKSRFAKPAIDDVDNLHPKEYIILQDFIEVQALRLTAG